MSVLRRVIADMLECQQRYENLVGLERKWRPENGWDPGSVLLAQWRQGLAAQVHGMRACSDMLAANFVAANDETPPQAA